MSRVFKSCTNEPPDTDRYVNVFFKGEGMFGGAYETIGTFKEGIWTSKQRKLTNQIPDEWREVDWKDTVFSGFYEELTKERIAELQNEVKG